MNKVKNLYKFLQEYNKIKNPDILDINQHPYNIDFAEIRNNDHTRFHDDSNILFEISKIKTKDIPLIPYILEGWIDVDSLKESGEFEFFEKRMSVESETFEFFVDNSDRVEELERYRNIFEKWKFENDKILVNNMLFFKLYSNLYLKLDEEFESYELLLGSALLNFSSQNKNIHHHLLTQKIAIEFDARVNRLIFSYADPNIDFNSSLIRDVKGIDYRKFDQIRKELDSEEFNLTSDYKRIDNQLNELLNPATLYSYTNFSIENNNTLLLIKKSYGFSKFINSILEDIDQNPNKTYPEFLIDLIDTSNKDFHTLNNVESSIEEDAELLLTLPSNNEQIEITKALKKNGAVLVQGPPGTGKTHTIANLIGHLLSEGKSVLVTAHTDKALSVLKSKVFKDDIVDLQSLCISVGKDRSQRKEMDHSINALSMYGSTFSEENVKKKIFSLENERKKIYAEIEHLKSEYKRIKRLSYQDFVYDNKTINPIDAAKFVGEGEDDYDYLDFETANYHLALPVTPTELEKLYLINSNLQEEDLKVLLVNNDNFQHFWSIEDYSSRINYLNELRNLEAVEEIDEYLDIHTILDELNTADDILKKLKTIVTLHDLFNFSITDKAKSKLLLEAYKDLETLLNGLDIYEDVKFRYDIQILENFTENIARELEKRVSKSSKKPFTIIDTMFNKDLIQSFQTNLDKNTIDTLRNVLSVYAFERDLNNAIAAINKYSTFKDVSLNLSNFKRIIHMIPDYELALTMYHSHIKYYFNKLNVSFFEFSDNQYEKISNIIEDIIKKKTLQTVKYNIEKTESELNDYLASVLKFKGSSDLYAKLIEAIKNRNVSEYADMYSAISSILDKANSLLEFNEIIHKIELIAPTWALRIRNKIPPHNLSKPPIDIEKAWKYTQLKQQLSVVNEEFKADIESKIYRAEQKQLENARLLANEKAWYTAFKKQTSQLQQDLVSWGQQMKRLPKTITAKSFKPIMHELNRLTPRCQSAIPLWIMPISQVVNIYSAGNNQFDVIIVDEASQADMLSLAVLYLGKQVVVVGDDKQVSPSPVGIPLETISTLQTEYLDEVRIKTLLNVDTSLYSLAQLALFKKVVLKEHFRCVPDIIHFSNQKFYDMQIKPLRDTSNLPYSSFIMPHRVPNGYRDTKKAINLNEAEEIIRLMTLMNEDEKYYSKTFGVITMIGHDQSKLILNMIQIRLGLEFIHKRKIQVGSASQFQGDERDIMFISFIDDKDSIRALNLDDGNNRHSKEYNVALSRARDQLYLIHSFNPESDLKHDDIRAHLFSYANNPLSSISESEISKTESIFEMEIFQALTTAGYNVKSQFKISNYRIDLVVESSNSRVAIECDGEAFHTIDNYEDDLYRQNQLERLGWRFLRIRGSQYFSNKTATIRDLIQKIDELGIQRITESRSSVTLMNSSKYFEEASPEILNMINDFINEDEEQERIVLEFFRS